MGREVCFAESDAMQDYATPRPPFLIGRNSTPKHVFHIREGRDPPPFFWVGPVFTPGDYTFQPPEEPSQGLWPRPKGTTGGRM